MRLTVTNKLGMKYSLESICGNEERTKITLFPDSREPKMMTISIPLQETYKKWRAWDNGLNIANAFPELNENEMEFIMTGWTDRN